MTLTKPIFSMPPQVNPILKARSARDVCLEDCMALLGYQLSDKRNLGRVLRMLKGKTPRDIYELMSRAKEGEKPAGLFVWLCKKGV